MHVTPLSRTLLALLTSASILAGCSDSEDGAPACTSEPVLRTTAAGVEFVRTPQSCFEGLEGYAYDYKHVEIDGMRQAYAEDGPADADPVLLLHGQPSWSYLYRKMIPVLVKGGHRVIAMDHLGTGRSDKPTSIKSYSFLGHVERLEQFITKMGLKNITLFCQDWGSLIGLHVAGKHPEWFARIMVGDGALPVVPAGTQLYPDVQDPETIIPDLKPPFADIPDQQPEFFDKDGNPLTQGDPDYFSKWMEYAMKSGQFRASAVLEAMTYFPLSPEVEAAYDAPFPSRTYMAGIRVFPSLANELGGVNQTSWDGLKAYTKPFLTIWASNDPGNLGSIQGQDNFICNVPGAKDLPHTRLAKASHFLQDDQGEAIATRMVEFMAGSTSLKAEHTATCGLPIAPDGTGTLCADDTECAALTAKKCVSVLGATGFCTVEGCTAGSCADKYVCCHDCNPAAAPLLPFNGSACFPAGQTGPLGTAAGCTCD
jgi:haloalkane dehalogenase